MDELLVMQMKVIQSRKMRINNSSSIWINSYKHERQSATSPTTPHLQICENVSGLRLRQWKKNAQFDFEEENTISQVSTWLNLQTCWIWTLVLQEFVSCSNSVIKSADAKPHYPNVPGKKSATCSLLSDTFTDCWGHVSLTTRRVSSALSSQITRCICVMWLHNRSLFMSRFACTSTTLKSQRSSACIHDLPTQPFALHVNFTRFVDMQWPWTCVRVFSLTCTP